MTEDTIRISEETKDRLEDIKQNYYEHTTLTYSECVDVLVAEYETETTRVTREDSSESDVTRTIDGGDGESSEDDEFQTGGMSAEERANQFKVD